MAVRTDNKKQTCTTGVPLICRLCSLLAEDLSIRSRYVPSDCGREFCVPEERKLIYGDDRLRGRAGSTSCRPPLLRLFNSHADCSINRTSAISYNVSYARPFEAVSQAISFHGHKASSFNAMMEHIHGAHPEKGGGKHCQACI